MQWYERLDEKIRDYLPDMTVERDVPMACPAWSSPCW